MSEADTATTSAETSGGGAATDTEATARRMGWRPKEEFHGDPERWTDAKTFVERGEAELPVLRERYKALDNRFAQLQTSSERDLAGLRTKLDDQGKVLLEFREFSRRAEERAYQRAKTELEQRMQAAVATADMQGYERARQELAQLDRDRPPIVDPKATEAEAAAKLKDTPAQPPKEIRDWVAENQWFERDGAMRSYAIGLHGDLLRDKPGLSLTENLAEVRKDVLARFPEKFGNPKREQAPAVNAPSAPAKATKGKTYNDLPPEAKAVCDKYVREINARKPKEPYTREEYVKMYFAGDEE